ncbi:pirin family protein [Nocardioides sp. ChNu-153]|uniref:pirin family protein n=1 Tax=unclassified Nocardioides TaxID=2615069 RepID=UPI002407760B|nr:MULTISPECIES: pirin family protein [unclassified Nocardioides]MDF9716173.1 pirin family protein [Nocardioides sp. ChNu-99]MDN7121563.1 pirin family protein [Nocardioides sp. ChNu-153]
MSAAGGPGEVRRGADAFRTVRDDRTTVHAFSFGPHYDAANLGFGPMVCHNDDRVAPGGGYPDHPHTDLEIVTWVLDGELTHTDTVDGSRAALGAGTVQVTSAGSGIRHSELVDPAAGPTRFLQVWLRPDEPGRPPRTTRTTAVLDPDGFTPLAGAGGLPLGTRGARLLVARPRAGVPLRLPDAPLLHLYVARGAVTLPERGPLGTQPDGGYDGPAAPGGGEGDAWRLRDAGEQVVVPRDDGTELVVWAFDADA